MSNLELTKDADTTMCLIYEKYLTRIKNNISKSEASLFEAFKFNQDFPSLKHDDLLTNLNELQHNNLITKYIDGSFVLKSDGIIYMENRFKKGLIEVTDFIAKFIP